MSVPASEIVCAPGACCSIGPHVMPLYAVRTAEKPHISAE